MDFYVTTTHVSRFTSFRSQISTLSLIKVEQSLCQINYIQTILIKILDCKLFVCIMLDQAYQHGQQPTK